jgi:branched-subunit amino acid transport protein
VNSTFVVLAAAGAVTWPLRGALIVFVASTDIGDRIAAALRYAPPAAFAAVAVSSLIVASQDTGDALWRYAVAAGVTAMTARPGRNVAGPLLAGAATVTLLTFV